MILQREISQKANEWKVADTTVDKDYVLGHFLNCFFNFGHNRDLFVFKGGTCLRKCYFSDYRFSEDLDFTLKDTEFQVDEAFILNIAQACSNQSGIQFHLNKFEKKRSLNEDKGYKGVITFWGANHSRNKPPSPRERWTTKIEIDITFDEEILFPVNQIQIYHPYSDRDMTFSNTIPVYSLEEILTEKIRSFFQRSYKAPRDFYDVWYLLQNYEFTDWGKISHILKKKCELKNKKIDPLLFEDENVYKTLSKSWNHSITHHLPPEKLPEFTDVWEFLKSHLFAACLRPFS